MLTAENKVEEWPYHPNPQDKFPSRSFRQKSLRCCGFFVAGVWFWWNGLSLLPPLGDPLQIFFRTGKMHVFLPNAEPSFLVAARLMTVFADPLCLIETHVSQLHRCLHLAEQSQPGCKETLNYQRCVPLRPPRKPPCDPLPARSTFGRASLMLSARPPTMVPFNAAMALPAPSDSAISTKAKPFERAVSR